MIIVVEQSLKNEVDPINLLESNIKKITAHRSRSRILPIKRASGTNSAAADQPAFRIPTPRKML
jgi:hypothetical protein